MIKIEPATEAHSQILAMLGRITYTESHGDFIKDRNDLLRYNDQAFSISRTKRDLSDKQNLFFIAYQSGFPVGYAKLMLNQTHASIASKNACRLDKIYILNEFLPLKIGQVFLAFLEAKVQELGLNTIWLATYIKNFRAIRFYEKNEYVAVGKLDFSVNGTAYENLVFSKRLEL